MAEVIIPVFHVTASGGQLTAPETANPQAFCRANPCIQIGFFYDPRAFDNQIGNYKFDKCTALVDTGADGVYADYSLIGKWSCPVAEGGENMTVNAEPNHTAHKACLFLLQDNSIVYLWVQGRDFASEHRPFRLVLGRRFLQFCTLLYDGHRQSVTLRYEMRPSAW